MFENFVMDSSGILTESEIKALLEITNGCAQRFELLVNGNSPTLLLGFRDDPEFMVKRGIDGEQLAEKLRKLSPEQAAYLLGYSRGFWDASTAVENAKVVRNYPRSGFNRG